MATQHVGIKIHIQLNVGMCHLRFIGVGLQEENRMFDQSTRASLAHGSEGQLGMQAAALGNNWHHKVQLACIPSNRDGQKPTCELCSAHDRRAGMAG